MVENMKRIKITEEIVGFEIAKMAKDKGYQVGTRKSYCRYHSSFTYDGEKTHPESHKKNDVLLDYDFYTVNNVEGVDMSNNHYTIYEAPSLSLLQRWLREAHNINVYCVCKVGQYRYWIDKVSPNDQETTTYEKSLEAGLQEALTNIEKLSK